MPLELRSCYSYELSTFSLNSALISFEQLKNLNRLWSLTAELEFWVWEMFIYPILPSTFRSTWSMIRIISLPELRQIPWKFLVWSLMLIKGGSNNMALSIVPFWVRKLMSLFMKVIWSADRLPDWIKPTKADWQSPDRVPECCGWICPEACHRIHVCQLGSNDIRPEINLCHVNLRLKYAWNPWLVSFLKGTS